MAFLQVEIGSLSQIIPIAIAVGLLFLFVKIGKKSSIEKQRSIIHYFAIGVSLFLIVFHLHKAIFLQYSLKEDLPLFLCSFVALFIPLFTYYRKLWMYEIISFWVLVGTFQAVLTPDIPVDFPSFDYFRYWVVHLGLSIIIFYYIIMFKPKTTWESPMVSFVALIIYLMIMYLVNELLGANYCYLNEKPESTSALDLLGDWPDYVFKAIGFLFFIFLLLQALVELLKRKK